MRMTRDNGLFQCECLSLAISSLPLNLKWGTGRRSGYTRDNDWDQCRSMVQYSFTSTETRRLVRTNSPGRPPRLVSDWHSSCDYGRTRGEELKNEIAAGSRRLGLSESVKWNWEGVKEDTAGEGTEDVVTLSLELVGVGHTPSTAFSPAPFVYLRAAAHPRRGQRPEVTPQWSHSVQRRKDVVIVLGVWVLVSVPPSWSGGNISQVSELTAVPGGASPRPWQSDRVAAAGMKTLAPGTVPQSFHCYFPPHRHFFFGLTGVIQRLSLGPTGQCRIATVTRPDRSVSYSDCHSARQVSVV